MLHDDLVLFMHIPKSGGTTARRVLGESLPSKYIFDCYWAQLGKTIEDLLWLDDAERDLIQVVYGHFFYGMHALFPRRWRYVTILRDPIDRVTSQFYHQKRNSEIFGISPNSSDEETLSEIFRRGDFQYCNLATRMISGYGPRNIATEQMLERAIANLRREFCYVGKIPGNGVQGAVSATLNVPDKLSNHILNLNVGQGEHTLSLRARELVRQHNRADLALYDLVK